MVNVVIADAKGIITNSGDDVILRHSKYGEALRKIDPDSRLIILSRCKTLTGPEFRDIEVHRCGNLVDFFRQGREILKNSIDNFVLVGGDPWESFLSCLVLRKLSKKRIPIQMQLHADVGSSVWKKISWKNRIRFEVLKFTLPRSDQIRFVSAPQLQNLEKRFPKVAQKSVVIPVPLRYELNYLENRKRDKNTSIALIGRIHKDRGLSEFVRVCSILAKEEQKLVIYIVGEGPHMDWLTNRLREENLISQTIFTGFKSQDELAQMWKNFGCVASLAPSEAYGRSARESLLHGVPVMAIASAGLAKLGEEFKEQGIWYIDNKSDTEIAVLFERLADFVVPITVGTSIVDEVSTLNEQIARSWINLVSQIAQKKSG